MTVTIVASISRTRNTTLPRAIRHHAPLSLPRVPRVNSDFSNPVATSFSRWKSSNSVQDFRQRPPLLNNAAQCTLFSHEYHGIHHLKFSERRSERLLKSSRCINTSSQPLLSTETKEVSTTDFSEPNIEIAAATEAPDDHSETTNNVRANGTSEVTSASKPKIVPQTYGYNKIITNLYHQNKTQIGPRKNYKKNRIRNPGSKQNFRPNAISRKEEIKNSCDHLNESGKSLDIRENQGNPKTRTKTEVRNSCSHLNKTEEYENEGTLETSTKNEVENSFNHLNEGIKSLQNNEASVGEIEGTLETNTNNEIENSRNHLNEREKSTPNKKIDMRENDGYREKSTKNEMGNYRNHRNEGEKYLPNKKVAIRENKGDRHTSSKNVYFSKPKNRSFAHNKVPSPDQKEHNRVATSPWILVTNTPPMSHLSDIFPSLERLLQFELQKGIVDLDAVDSMDEEKFTRDNVDIIGTNVHRQRRLQHRGNDLWKELDDLEHNFRSFDSLWQPPDFSSDYDPLPPHMILEARLHLSYRARPLGWFLRFPNRSVVNAILNHTREAKELDRIELKQIRKENMERKKWREDLWRNVMKNGVPGATQQIEGGETDVDERDEFEPLDKTKEHEEHSSHHDADEDLLSKTSRVSTNNYKPLTCGMAKLEVNQFHPISFDNRHHQTQTNIPWEQHSFHLGPYLNLSDSVIRVETDSLITTADDVKYFLRDYSLKSVFPSPSQPPIPSDFIHQPRNIGWNMSSISFNGKSASISPVEHLVHGTDPNRNRRPQESGGVRRPKFHSFLVRFASSADARMAYRERQGFVVKGGTWRLTQYPRVDGY